MVHLLCEIAIGVVVSVAITAAGLAIGYYASNVCDLIAGGDDE